MSDTAPLQLACRFCRPLVEGCPSVFEITLTSIVPEPVRDIVIEFRCAGLRGGVAERTLTKPLTAFEVLTLDMDIDPERKGTPPMTVHLHASTSRGRFTAHGSVRPGGQAGISILERPENLQSLTVQIQEKAFFGAMLAEGGIDIGKVKSLNDFLQLHLPVPMETVALSWDGFPVVRGLKVGFVFAKRFELIRPLGQGGMGVVWLAADGALKGRHVALKFLPQEVCHAPGAIDDLRDEVLKARDLSHENIVRIYDLIEADGTAAISMEYIDGPTLDELRRSQREKVLEVPDLEPLLPPLCSALDHAHEHRLVHHDIKPLNLMLTSQGVIKVCDFGLAGSLVESRSRLSRPGHTSGTTPYMSPQQLLLGTRTVADDIYSLGATLYELLTSKPPFFRGSIESQVESVVPPSVSERRQMLGIRGRASIPARWENALADCLAKDPKKRPASNAGLLKALSKDGARVLMQKATPLMAEGFATTRKSSAAALGGLARLAGRLKTQVTRITKTLVLATASAWNSITFDWRQTDDHQAENESLENFASQDVPQTSGAKMVWWKKPLQMSNRLLKAPGKEACGRRLQIRFTVLSSFIPLNLLIEEKLGEALVFLIFVFLSTFMWWDAFWLRRTDLGPRTGKSVWRALLFLPLLVGGVFACDGLCRWWFKIESVLLFGCTMMLALEVYHLALLRCLFGHQPSSSRHLVILAASSVLSGLALWGISGSKNQYGWLELNLVPLEIEIVILIMFACHVRWTYPLQVLEEPPWARRWLPRIAWFILLLPLLWPAASKAWLETELYLTRRHIIQTFSPYAQETVSLSWSPDGTRLLSASSYGSEVVLSEAPTGALLKSWNGEECCAFSPDGKLLAHSSRDEGIIIRNSSSGIQTHAIDKYGARKCLFSRDGKQLYGLKSGGWVDIYEIASGKSIKTISGPSDFIALGADQTFFSADRKDRSVVKLWDSNTGGEVRSFKGHRNAVLACVAKWDGTRLVTASLDNTLKVWNAETGVELHTLTGHSDAVTACTMSPDGRWVLSGSDDHSVRLWNVETGACHGSWLFLSGISALEWKTVRSGVWPEYTTGNTQVAAVATGVRAILSGDIHEIHLLNLTDAVR